MNTEEFYKLPKDLALADGFIGKETGEAINLTSSGKIVYAYMLSRNEFFTGKMEGKHYETQRTIAKACGLEEKACGKILRTFIDHGVLSGKKLRPNGEGQWRWHYYKVFTDIMLWTGSKESFEIVEKKALQPKEKSVDSKNTVPDWLDESDLPF